MTFDTNILEEIEIIDLNNILDEYEVTKTKEFEYKIEDNKLIIKPLVVGNIRKHTLQEYWEAGLRDIWSFKVVREFGSQIKCIDDMQGTNPLYPRVWVDKDIYIDLIDGDLNDLEQLKQYL